MKKRLGLVLMVVALLFILSNLNNKKNETIEDLIEEITESKFEYGILVDSFNVTKGILKKDQTLG